MKAVGALIAIALALAHQAVAVAVLTLGVLHLERLWPRTASSFAGALHQPVAIGNR